MIASRVGRVEGDCAIVEHYVAQQERFLALAEASSMASLALDTSEPGLSETLAEVLAFWLG